MINAYLKPVTIHELSQIIGSSVFSKTPLRLFLK